MNNVGATYIDKLKHWARTLKQNVLALYLAYKDPRVPWYAKWIAICVVAYACSPIDLIPDFIPVLGYLDDLILIPLGVALALRFIPKPILEEHLAKVKELGKRKPKNWLVGALFIAIWILCAAWIGIMAYHVKRPQN